MKAIGNILSAGVFLLMADGSVLGALMPSTPPQQARGLLVLAMLAAVTVIIKIIVSLPHRKRRGNLFIKRLQIASRSS
ncbi:MAG TPA: hypothetical protein VJB70_00180 [Candidatus Paceibacterota bacterium]